MGGRRESSQKSGDTEQMSAGGREESFQWSGDTRGLAVQASDGDEVARGSPSKTEQ